MKTKDSFDIKTGDTLYNTWGESRKVTSVYEFQCYHTDMEGGGIATSSEGALWSLYHSEKTALNNHLEYICRKAWELEREAGQYRERETKARLRVAELEKQEEYQRQAE